mgnify:CR=1 FL=1
MSSALFLLMSSFGVHFRRRASSDLCSDRYPSNFVSLSLYKQTPISVPASTSGGEKGQGFGKNTYWKNLHVVFAVEEYSLVVLMKRFHILPGVEGRGSDAVLRAGAGCSSRSLKMAANQQE